MPLAIKTLKDEYLFDEPFRKRFLREAEIWVRLERHMNIVRAFYVKVIEGRPYIFLEYVVGDKQYGADLSGWIDRGGLEIPLALRFSIQVCTGMIHAEEKLGRNFVHRDIKPKNILITQDKVAKVTDFGIAKAFMEVDEDIEVKRSEKERSGFTKAGHIVGTPPYMSPEQWQGEKELSIPSDIYSFGCVLYEMLTGRPPFLIEGAPPYVYKAHHMEVKPEPPRRLNRTIPKELDEVVMKCLEKEADKRYKDFSSLREDLLSIYKKETGEEFKIEKKSIELDAWEWNNKGVSFAELGKHKEAIDALSNFIRLAPPQLAEDVEMAKALIRQLSGRV
jgi:serine/threonine protein kinase